jgi:radical SAM superfamily enzyme YgiQ (UPF0313 family)
VGQISANLLKDEELVDLIAESGGKWIFIGMESLDPKNLADVNKSFNKPSDYAAVLDRLARRNVYAITSFIFGLDNDEVGVADRTLEQIKNWAPGLPVFGQITPFPATPLYHRLQREGRLTRPKHWLEFAPFQMAHEPKKMTPAQVETEVRTAWRESYSSERTGQALDSINDQALPYRISHLLARMFFRGIYFPQKGTFAWLRLLAEHRDILGAMFREGFSRGITTDRSGKKLDFETGASSYGAD